MHHPVGWRCEQDREPGLPPNYTNVCHPNQTQAGVDCRRLPLDTAVQRYFSAAHNHHRLVSKTDDVSGGRTPLPWLPFAPW